MHLTLHLTNKCNLVCKYCFVTLGPEHMTKEIAFAAIKFATQSNRPTGLLFYGGEPLLERTLIYDIVARTKTINEATGHVFYYKMTTNGVLLDEDFLKFAADINLSIGFSHDGPAQDDCRVFPNGNGTAVLLAEKIPLLLKYQPYAIGMSVIDLSTVNKAAVTVKFLHDHGFKYITANVNYDAPWTKKSLAVLEGEYRKMAEMYIKWTRAEEKFYLSPFDQKILSHIKGVKYNADRRKMAQNQLSVAPDGKLYSSSRYIDNQAFAIGDVFNGVDAEKQQFLAEKGVSPPAPCQECAILTRCNYAYDNFKRDEINIAEVTADISPISCAHEQILTPIADYVAETLYRENNALFIHKHYNEMYPIMSLVEDGNIKNLS